MVCEVLRFCNFNDDISNYDLFLFGGNYNFKNFGNYIISFYYNAIAAALIAYCFKALLQYK